MTVAVYNDEYELTFNRHDDLDKEVSPTKRTRRQSGALVERKVISIKRKLDAMEMQIGDFVAVKTAEKASDLALLTQFNETDGGFLRARLLWMVKPRDVDREDADPGCMYATNLIDWAEVSSLESVVELVSKKEFSQIVAKKRSQMKGARAKSFVPKDLYYCEHLAEMRYHKLSARFDLRDFYNDDGSVNTQQYEDTMNNEADALKKKSQRPTTPSKPKNNNSPSKKRKIEYVSDDGGDSASEEDGEEEEDELEKIMQKRQKLASPKKNLGATPKHTPKLPSRVVDVLTPGKKTKQPVLDPYKQAQKTLHVSAVPDSLPCREQEYGQIYMALESAINAGSGSCVYVSGIPGTGKTATVREVVTELQSQAKQDQIPHFSFVEINGMKVINPQDSYEMLWQHISGKRVAPATSLRLLEQEFSTPSPRRTPIVVLMDELDQLVTKNQSVMYNFFNWPTLQHSQLIVVAVANTMDLPERTLSNKISSRLGLTRVQFSTYTAQQLQTIIQSRLQSNPVVMDKAIVYASKALSRVGDARRALDICRRAVELAESREEKVDISHIIEANKEMTNSPMAQYLMGLPTAYKVFLCAVLARLRRGGHGSAPMSDILRECKHLTSINADVQSDKLKHYLFNDTIRMHGFMNALCELVEGGVLAQSSTKGEVSANVQLAMGSEEVRLALKDDVDVSGML